MAPAADPATPLWRAAQVFRLLSCGYALGFQIVVNDELERPVIAWALFAVLIGWSVACAGAYLHGYGRRRSWVLTEVTVVVALMLSTEVVASPTWVPEHQSLPTTLWATNATISAAVLLGPVGGMVGALLITAASAVLNGYASIDVGRNATVVIELAVGLAVGMAAQTARRAHADLQRAAKIEASLQERERLSRDIHDGAIQVLALVARRGREIGGATNELAELAGEQERALRRWVTDAGTRSPRGVEADLVAMLRSHASDRVSVSLPATAVLLDPVVAGEIDAAVTNALDNVVAHAGADARAFVLLEELEDSVVIGIRDDGVGIPAGRLEEAVEQGRVGVSKSIVGRLDWIGGQARLSTEPGRGTEWELTIPRSP